jgi:hypothetical protein
VMLLPSGIMLPVSGFLQPEEQLSSHLQHIPERHRAEQYIPQFSSMRVRV